MRIDAHYHLWRYRADAFAWITPELSALRRDFTADDAAPLMAAQGVTGSVVVQAQTHPEETDWLVAQAARLPGVHGVVGWLDPSQPMERVEAALEKWAEHRSIRGGRHLVQDERDPAAWLAQGTLKAGMAALQRRGYTWDVLITHRHIAQAADFAARHDGHWLVVDHCAKPLIAGGAQAWARQMAPLAALPHVACKISGLVTEAPGQWQPAQLIPFIDAALTLFGPERLLFGSDWPVALTVVRHNALFAFYQAALGSLSAHEQQAIWGANAWKIYNLAECEYGS